MRRQKLERSDAERIRVIEEQRRIQEDQLRRAEDIRREDDHRLFREQEIGDCAKQGTPKAGLFAEGAARAVATAVIARMRSGFTAVPHEGKGSCYLEFGGGLIGRVDVDFFSHPEGPMGTYYPPSLAMRANKEQFGASRRARWFGL